MIENREPIHDLELHAFGDASTQEVGTAVYAVVQQPSGTTRRLVAAKGWLAKQGLTVPRLELIAAHMATNLVANLENTLSDLFNPRVYAWLDSTVALHWILGSSSLCPIELRKFVSTRRLNGDMYQHMTTQLTWRVGEEQLLICGGTDLNGLPTRENGPPTQ